MRIKDRRRSLERIADLSTRVLWLFVGNAVAVAVAVAVVMVERETGGGRDRAVLVVTC
jgi:hypothetical protein